VCLLLQYLLQCCSRDGTREETGTLTQGGAVCVRPVFPGLCVCLLLQYLIQSCARGGRRIVEDMCYEIRRAEACVD
jgi:hypothetical protein